MAFAPLLAAVDGMQLSSIDRKFKETWAEDAQSMFEKAEKMVEAIDEIDEDSGVGVGVGVGVGSQDSGHCPDIAGTYDNGHGKPVKVTQDGCAVEVTLYWDEKNPEVMKTGTVDGASVSIRDFDKPGRFSDGEVVFSDGGHWKKMGQAKPEAKPEAKADITTAEARSQAEAKASADALDFPDAKPAATTEQEAPKGTWDAPQGKEPDEKPEAEPEQEAEPEAKPDAEPDQEAASSVDAIPRPIIESITKAVMKDIAKDMPEVIEAAIKANEAAATTSDEASADPSDISSADSLEQSAAASELPSASASVADVEQSDGEPLFRPQTDAVVAGEQAGDLSSNVDLVNNALNGKECVNVNGHYANSGGKLVTVKQDGCTVEVLMYWDEEQGDVVKTGAVQGSSVTVDGFGAAGFVHEKNVEFQDGGVWKKLEGTELESFKEDGCSDMSGFYTETSGKLIKISQAGCHAMLDIVDTDSKDHFKKLGTVNENQLTVSGFGRVGTKSDQFGLDFGDGLRWGKLASSAADATSEETCADAAGNYRDEKGDTTRITQEDCHVYVQMHWDQEKGHVSLKGYVFGNIVHVKDFSSLGKVDASSQSLHWFDGNDWAKLSLDESTELGMTSAGCTDFSGVYTDEDGQPVVLNQMDDCQIQVLFWLESLNSNVTKRGHVTSDTVHIDEFTADGVFVNGDINFANLTMWKSTNQERLLQRSASLVERFDQEYKAVTVAKADVTVTVAKADAKASGVTVAKADVTVTVAKADAKASGVTVAKADADVESIIKGCDWKCYVERYPILRNEKWEREHGNLDYARDHYVRAGHSKGKNCRCDETSP